MAITQSGYYGLTLEKQFKKTVAGDMESTNVATMLVKDTYTSTGFDTHDFRADISTSNEVTTGSGYTAGGTAFSVAPTWTIGSPTTGSIAYDSSNPTWATSTITDAMAAVLYYSTGTSGTDELFLLSDFGTAVSTANGTLTVTVDTNGWMYVDYAV